VVEERARAEREPSWKQRRKGRQPRPSTEESSGQVRPVWRTDCCVDAAVTPPRDEKGNPTRVASVANGASRGGFGGGVGPLGTEK
jgi:hypothetical protein